MRGEGWIDSHVDILFLISTEVCIVTIKGDP
jgi:hypothetical protein